MSYRLVNILSIINIFKWFLSLQLTGKEFGEVLSFGQTLLLSETMVSLFSVAADS